MAWAAVDVGLRSMALLSMSACLHRVGLSGDRLARARRQVADVVMSVPVSGSVTVTLVSVTLPLLVTVMS